MPAPGPEGYRKETKCDPGTTCRNESLPPRLPGGSVDKSPDGGVTRPGSGPRLPGGSVDKFPGGDVTRPRSGPRLPGGSVDKFPGDPSLFASEDERHAFWRGFMGRLDEMKDDYAEAVTWVKDAFGGGDKEGDFAKAWRDLAGNLWQMVKLCWKILIASDVLPLARYYPQYDEYRRELRDLGLTMTKEFADGYRRAYKEGGILQCVGRALADVLVLIATILVTKGAGQAARATKLSKLAKYVPDKIKKKLNIEPHPESMGPPPKPAAAPSPPAAAPPSTPAKPPPSPPKPAASPPPSPPASGPGRSGGKPIHSRYGDGTPVYEGEQPPRLGAPKPDPDAGGEHSRLRIDKKNNRVYQGREFDGEGKPVRDIDFTNPTYPDGKPRPGHPGPPHQHEFIPNDPKNHKAGYKRGKPNPM